METGEQEGFPKGRDYTQGISCATFPGVRPGESPEDEGVLWVRASVLCERPLGSCCEWVFVLMAGRGSPHKDGWFWCYCSILSAPDK